MPDGILGLLLEVSKAQGRKSSKKNLVMGGENSEEKWRAIDKQVG